MKFAEMAAVAKTVMAKGPWTVTVPGVKVLYQGYNKVAVKAALGKGFAVVLKSPMAETHLTMTDAMQFAAVAL